MYWGLAGNVGTQGPEGVSGALGAPRGCWGLLWGNQEGVRGVGGVRGGLGWQVDWKPNHIGPQSRVPALPLVPLGE